MIRVYTTPNCVQCDMTKKVLKRAEVEFEVIDLSQDEESMAMVKAMGYSAAPVVVAGSDHWSGFKNEKLKDAIDKARAR